MTITGLSLYIPIGRWGGIGLDGNERIVRLVLGWLSIGFVAADIEVVIGEAGRILKEKEPTK